MPPRKRVPSLQQIAEDVLALPIQSQEVLLKRYGVSRTYFHRHLKQLGYTYGELERALRFGAAQEMLLETNDLVGTISRRLGFSSHHGFSRTFKQMFGMTPQEYRQRVRRSTDVDEVKRVTVSFEVIPKEFINMPEPKRVRLDNNLYEPLRKYCRDNKVSMTRVVAEALRAFLDKENYLALDEASE